MSTEPLSYPVLAEPAGECDVLVIGAGISGLVAAREAIKRGLRTQVIDVASYAGGKLRAGQVGGVTIDLGAESVIVRRPEGVQLLRSLGLEDELRYPGTASARVAFAGREVPVPTDTLMGVPGDIDAVEASGVLSPAGVQQLREPRPGPTVGDDISVADAIAPRVGAEVVDRLVEPLLGGVYAGRADRLSLRSTIPALWRQLREHDDLLTAVNAVRATQPPSDAPVFATIPGGIGRIPGELITREQIPVALGTPARRITRDGDGFIVDVGAAPEARTVRARSVIVATPAVKAARLLRGVCDDAAALLEQVETASVAVVALAYRRDDLRHPPPVTSGILVPVSVGTAVKAATYVTNKWPHLVPDNDLFIVRASIGRAGDPQALQYPDADLVAVARRDLAVLAGISGEPVDAYVQRWAGSLPQYDVGHHQRVAGIRAALSAVPGLAVAGATYDGIGIPGCINSAIAAAEAIASQFSKDSQPDG